MAVSGVLQEKHHAQVHLLLVADVLLDRSAPGDIGPSACVNKGIAMKSRTGSLPGRAGAVGARARPGGSDTTGPAGSLRLLRLAPLFVAAALVACTDQPTGTGAAQRPTVAVAPLLAQRITPMGEFNGRVEASASVDLRPRVSGYIEQVRYTEGAEVEKGQVLFTIDDRGYRAGLSSATAGLASARAGRVGTPRGRPVAGAGRAAGHRRRGVGATARGPGAGASTGAVGAGRRRSCKPRWSGPRCARRWPGERDVPASRPATW
ncbi:hypothetical protein Rta_30070 [Ramlibacter tataouinensis TTB310]|uniref:Multidrug resistance protein MdtA-like barrel-sandwich hybrid domain-containing protein n=1 Tax=Ramlibacter tataouinensis (strain ATCC BAA-407 / DSM 14655 / LMG 21543 / TTB310) TaxID=365046 RepID=F5XW13_RAMTT|nr:hypothetical protein Rta_30070 [Ramlibacter tataouinensis TTB310]